MGKYLNIIIVSYKYAVDIIWYSIYKDSTLQICIVRQNIVSTPFLKITWISCKWNYWEISPSSVWCELRVVQILSWVILVRDGKTAESKSFANPTSSLENLLKSLSTGYNKQHSYKPKQHILLTRNVNKSLSSLVIYTAVFSIICAMV